MYDIYIWIESWCTLLSAAVVYTYIHCCVCICINNILRTDLLLHFRPLGRTGWARRVDTLETLQQYSSTRSRDVGGYGQYRGRIAILRLALRAREWEHHGRQRNCCRLTRISYFTYISYTYAFIHICIQGLPRGSSVLTILIDVHSSSSSIDEGSPSVYTDGTIDSSIEVGVYFFISFNFQNSIKTFSFCTGCYWYVVHMYITAAVQQQQLYIHLYNR